MVLIWLIKGVFYKLFFIIYKNDWMQSHWMRWFNLLSKNRDVILNRAKDYYEMIKRDEGCKQEINTETYLKKKKI